MHNGDLRDKKSHLTKVFDVIKHNKGNLINSDERVLKSWRRCHNDFGLDPSAYNPVKVLSQNELKLHIGPIEEFIHIARDGMQQLYTQVRELGYVVLLCDKNGVTVDYIGNDRYETELRNCGLYLGADWNEDYIGTCAVGTAAIELSPITVHQSEHYNVANTSLTCSAAPILGPFGELIAILDVSALTSSSEKDSQYLLLRLVKMYADIIEASYFLQHYKKENILSFDNRRGVIKSHCRCLIAIDKDGTVVGANSHARKWIAKELGIKDICSPLLTGFEIGSLFYINKDQQEVIDSEEVITLKLYKSRQILYGLFIKPKVQLFKAYENKMEDNHLRDNEVPIEILKLSQDEPSMKKVNLLASKFAKTNISILIKGETGTGKELLARSIHESSLCRNKAFISVNCAAIPDSLIESELFGYRSGSFTGASSKGRKGLIEAAHEGTLFLDEIGDMPAALQTRLLRVLSERKIVPVGGIEEIPVNFRLISATHRDITQKDSSEEIPFREDLYHRVNGVTIELPPLRERQDLRYLATQVSSQNKPVEISDDAYKLMNEYTWPGNIRELKNIIEYTLVLNNGGLIEVHHLPVELAKSRNKKSKEIFDSLERRMASPEEGEKNRLTQILNQHHWNITEAARSLDKSRTTIYRKMKKYGIVAPNRLLS